MKKILTIIAIVLAFATNGLAQDFTFGARVGMNVANILGDNILNYGIISAESQTKLGLKLGVVGCFPLVDDIYLEPGIYYSPKGTKNEWTDAANDNHKMVCNLNYVEIPVNGVYKYEINNNLTVRGHFGPYFGFGISGKTKYEVNGKTIPDSKQKNFSSKSGNLNRNTFDFGLNIGAGIEFSVCYLGVQYGLGITNISKYDNEKFRNGVFAVEFGVNF